MKCLMHRQLTFNVEEELEGLTNEKCEVGPDVLMVGTGEYTTGYVNGSEPDSDKGAGVVALVCLDLKRRGKVNRLGLCGKQGRKLVGVMQHMKHHIEDVYLGIKTGTLETWPAVNTSDGLAYEKAMNTYKMGDACTIFTPDDTHFAIALAAIKRGMHVLLAKPLVKTLEQHKKLLSAAKESDVLVMVDVHKRFDPIYVDAKDRIQGLGNFNYLYSYMSQPKHQLDTFREWAGESSDISFYLNSHHVDFHQWAMKGRARPTRVIAASSFGVAQSKGINTEDTITLIVTWEVSGW